MIIVVLVGRYEPAPAVKAKKRFLPLLLFLHTLMKKMNPEGDETDAQYN
jgi:hypothetical protein